MHCFGHSLGNFDAPLRAETLHGFSGHHAQALILAFEDASLLDAGALGDPRVVRIHHRFQYGIAQNEVRQVALDGGYCSGGSHGHGVIGTLRGYDR